MLEPDGNYYWNGGFLGIDYVNIDFLGEQGQRDLYYISHLTKEYFLRLGFDVAF